MKKSTCSAVSSHLTDSRHVVIHTVMHECMPANINKVEDLALSQEDKPQKQFTMEKLHKELAYFWWAS